jgi:hypothetical protein
LPAAAAAAFGDRRQKKPCLLAPLVSFDPHAHVLSLPGKIKKNAQHTAGGECTQTQPYVPTPPRERGGSAPSVVRRSGMSTHAQ